MTEADRPAAAAADGVTGAEIERLLAGSPLFAPDASELVQALADHVTVESVPAGAHLMSQGDTADAAFLVVRGRFRVTVSGTDGSRATVGELGRGEVVGEMSLLTDERRSATVTAIRDSTVVRLGSEVFARVLGEYPDLLRGITTRLVERLRRSISGETSTSTISSLAVVPLDGPLEPWFARAFLDRLRRQVDDLSVIDREGGERRLGDVEAVHDLTVLMADPEPSPWTRRCVESADAVVLVTDRPHHPERRSVEAGVWDVPPAMLPPTHLVLIHGARPSGTSAWQTGRDLRRHHHVRHGAFDHLDRVARALLERERVLVFSGGGAKGMAHLGVYREILERGIEIDAAGGTSSGSIFASLPADDRTYPQGLDLWRTFMGDQGSALDLTFPAVSLASGRRIGWRLRHGLGPGHIEDLWKAYFCVSTNLTTGRQVVHRTGPLWRAVRCSSSIPGVFPPMPHEGDLVVDGGLVENLPVSTMRDLHPGAEVIAVDVGGTREFRAGSVDDDGVANGWRLAGRRLLPFAQNPDVTGVTRILARLTELSSTNADADRGDVSIRPDVAHIGVLAFDRYEEAIELGAAAAADAFDRAGW